jgi:hypothetical protein
MINNKNSFVIIIQDGTSHYMKGVILFLCYIVIGACFFVQKIPLGKCMPSQKPFLTLITMYSKNMCIIVFILSPVTFSIFLTDQTNVNLGVEQSSGVL